MTERDHAKRLYVFTGGYDCGKTTTMQYLAEHFGYGIHPEAHLSVVHQLGSRVNGHSQDLPYTPVADPEHFCPLCNPLAFTQQVLRKQREIEQSACSGDLLERSAVDIFDYYLQKSGAHNIPCELRWEPAADYTAVFLLEPMAQTQRPRWGKSSSERFAEVQAITQRLAQRYERDGHPVIRVPPATVAARAEQIHHSIQQIAL